MPDARERVVTPWRPRAFFEPTGDAKFVTEPSTDEKVKREPVPTVDPTAAAREERKRLWQEGFEAGEAAAQEALRTETERVETLISKENRAFAQAATALAAMRAELESELAGTLEEVLEALCATALEHVWTRDAELLTRCVHAAMEAFDELHPSLQIRVSAADVARVESILADAALAVPVAADIELGLGQVRVDGVARAVELDLPDRFRRALNMLQEERA